MNVIREVAYVVSVLFVAFKLPFFYTYLLPILMGLFLWKRQQLSKHAKILVAYCLFTIFHEWAFAAVGVIYHNNLWMTRTWVYFEILFVLLFYRNLLSGKILKAMYLSALPVVGLITYYNILAHWTNYVDVEYVMYYFWMFGVIILYFIQTFREERVENLFADIGFLVGFVLVITRSITFLQNLFYNTLVYSSDLNHIAQFWSDVNKATIAGYNVLYALILWVTRLSRK